MGMGDDTEVMGTVSDAFPEDYMYVMDIGSSRLKFAHYQADRPEVFPCVVGRMGDVGNETMIKAGHELEELDQEERTLFKQTFPLWHGICHNWADMKIVWQTAFTGIDLDKDAC